MLTFGSEAEEEYEGCDYWRYQLLEKVYGSVGEELSQRLHHGRGVLTALPPNPTRMGSKGQGSLLVGGGRGEVVDVGQDGAQTPLRVEHHVGVRDEQTGASYHTWKIVV